MLSFRNESGSRRVSNIRSAASTLHDRRTIFVPARDGWESASRSMDNIFMIGRTLLQVHGH
ncbi:hypothetical protein ACVBGC_32175 [Burkholderia stagnalis]